MADSANITRRHTFKAAAVLVAMPAAALAHDPIVDAIGRFRDGLRAYRDYPLADTDDEDAIADRLFGQYEAVLINWDKPALTREGAAAALSIVQEETRFYADSPTANAMLRAAIGYLQTKS